MAPPKLARDAPWLDVAHPVEIDVRPVVRHELRAAVFHCLDRLVGERLDVEIPLLRHQRFEHDGLGLLIVRHGMGNRLDLVEQFDGFQIGDDLFARHEAIETTISFGHRVVQRAVLVQDVDERKIVTLADLKVVEVVARRDLHRARALLGIGMFVGNNRNQTVRQRQPHLFADEIPVALVIGMHGNRSVAQHCFRARGGDGDETARLPFDGIFQIPEVPLHLDVLDFEIGHGGLQTRIPVHKALVLVDQVLLVEFDKDFQHRARKAFVHREALARPIGRGAEAAKLLGDRAAGFIFPAPHLFEEFFAAQAHAALLLPRKLALDDKLGGDAGVVHAWLPQHVLAAHALEARERVLQRVVQRVADMQPAGDVRRRDDDGKRFGVRASARTEGAGAFPLRINPGFDLAGIESLVEHLSVFL